MCFNIICFRYTCVDSLRFKDYGSLSTQKMFAKAKLHLSLIFLFMITKAAQSQHQYGQSITDQSPHLIVPQGHHIVQNAHAGNTYRVSVYKCKEYTSKDDVDYITTRDISANIIRATENIDNSEEYLTPTKITTTIDKATENIKTTPETLTTNLRETTHYRDTLSKTSHKYSENKEYTNKVLMKTNDTESDIEYRTSHPVLAVIGGVSAIVGEFPHMAAIGWKNSNGSYRFDCGGSLISPKFVLTAAHCTYSRIADSPVPDVVKLGHHHIDGSIYIKTDPIQVTIKAIYKHPQYTHKTHYNDIALLELDVEVQFDYNIKPACLWSSRDFSFYSTAIATGWGAVDQYAEKRANELQKVYLHLLSNEKCNDSLENLINKKWDKGFIDSQLCAGEPAGGKDTCQGDSGSPLQLPMLEHPNRYYVIGITSFGPKICAQQPAVYTRVSSFLDWIESIVWPDEYIEWLSRAKF